MTIPFTKAHGAGNDFLLSWADRVPAADLASITRAICNRYTVSAPTAGCWCQTQSNLCQNERAIKPMDVKALDRLAKLAPADRGESGAAMLRAGEFESFLFLCERPTRWKALWLIASYHVVSRLFRPSAAGIVSLRLDRL